MDRDLAPLLSLLKGVRNGVVYGSKVRFPHALVYVKSFLDGLFWITLTDVSLQDDISFPLRNVRHPLADLVTPNLIHPQPPRKGQARPESHANARP